MAYVPIAPATLIVGLPGSGLAWPTLLANTVEAYENFVPTVLSCSTKLYTTSTSFVAMARLWVPGNFDGLGVRVRLWWRGTTGQTAVAKVDVTDGIGSNTAGVESTTSTYAWADVDVTPSSSSTEPRSVTLSLKVSGGIVQVSHVTCYLVPPTAPVGVQPSGWEGVLGWDLAAELAAVPRRIAEVLSNNARAVARDRPAGLIGIVDDLTRGSGLRYSTASTAWTLMDRGLMPDADAGADRVYRLIVDMEASGTAAPKALVTIGPYQATVTGAGVTVLTPNIAIGAGTPWSVHTAVASGTGTVYLPTAQLLREAA